MAEPRPINPYVVLVSAIILPGSGQVWNRLPFRGLTFLFFMVLLGAFTVVTAGPEISLVGKLSGGLFVYAISIFDAYKTARMRQALALVAPKA
ncbi:MAG: hypothetical protein ABI832_12740 [bacterium]